MQATAAVPSFYSHIAQSHDQDANDIPKPFKSTKSRGGKKSGKGKQRAQQQPQPSPLLPERNKKNNIKKQITITTMKITEVITEAADPKGDKKAVVGDLIEGPSLREGANKVTIEDNIKTTMGNTIHPVEVIIIIIMTITEAEMDGAMVAIITAVTVTEEAIIEAITIINTTSITHMMMDHRWNNMAHHAYYVVASTTPLNTVSRVSMT